MSRIGKQNIIIPEGVVVTKEDSTIRVKGPKGELARTVKSSVIDIDIEGSTIHLKPRLNSIEARQLWGTCGSHIKNMIIGVTSGFEKKLSIEGIGYRAQVTGDTLVLHVGFSHPVEVKPLPGISFKVEKNSIIVSGIDKEKVGEMAASIRSIKKPEPYKGKGIRYQNEVVRRKAGKKAATTAG